MRRVEVFAGAGVESGDGPADVEVTASASADELRPLERPRARMRVPIGRAEDSTRRKNLPERLEPGVTYRDVRVERRLAGRLTETRGPR